MTRRRRLRRGLLWTGVLLGLVLLLAMAFLLRAGTWVGRHVSQFTHIRREEAMKARKALVMVAVSVSAITVGAGVTMAGGSEQWRTALQLRGDAMNRQHGLGEYARKPAAAEKPAWRTALIVRSRALNRQYGLGNNARKPAGATQPAWREALMIRSEALNRMHKLGVYAPGS
jgi:hypothetical protein